MDWRRIHKLPLSLALIGLVAAVGILTQRYRTEQRNRAVEVVLEYADVRRLAAATGHSTADALRRFRAAGMTGLAVAEDTLQDLQQAGALRVQAAGEETRPGGHDTQISIGDNLTARRVVAHLTHKIPGTRPSPPPAGDRVRFEVRGRPLIYVPGAWDDIRSLPVGLDPIVVREVTAAGLTLVARPDNFLGARPDAIDWLLGELRAAGARTVIFAGEEIVGFQNQIRATAEALARHDLRYGAVEFGKQRGDASLQEQVPERVVRVHSIAGAEMTRLTLPEAIERYVRAAAERNIRLCYVRPPNAVLEDTFEDNVRYVAAIARGLQGAGLQLGPAPAVPRLFGAGLAGRLPALPVASGTAAMAVLLLALILPVPKRAQWRLTVLGSVVAGGAVLLTGSLGRQLVALAAALVGPVLAFVWIPLPAGATAEMASPVSGSPLRYACRHFLRLSLFSVLTGAMVAALLSEQQFLLKIRSFVGIKAAHVLPILAIGLVYLVGIEAGDSWPRTRQRAAQRARLFLDEPIRTWHALGLLVAVAALALLLLRTSNDTGVGVSSLEMKFRSVLDRVMLVRPRTKEFLIGHPLLILGLAWAASRRLSGSGWRRWSLPLLLLGAIGQVSIVNTFCHLHTPLHVTLLRVFNGVWLGGLLGLLLTWAVLRTAARAGPPGEPAVAAASSSGPDAVGTLG
ncbi:MAG: hypothetical protein HY320_05340 [Armatimonadetes bacterium]|nr:hypothetical protein [Armatimonadota bacterium]